MQALSQSLHMAVEKAQSCRMSTPLSYPQYQNRQLSQGVILRRCIALMLDFIFMGLLGFCMVFAITLFGLITFGFGWVAFHILPWLPLIYYILLIGGTGATPGQRLSGLAMQQDHSLTPPTFAQATVWSLFFWLSWVLAGLPFLIAFCNPRHRAAHDILSGLAFVRSV